VVASHRGSTAHGAPTAGGAALDGGCTSPTTVCMETLPLPLVPLAGSPGPPADASGDARTRGRGGDERRDVDAEVGSIRSPRGLNLDPVP
jgi:hypothetical protein